METFDHVIVGGGIIGASIAYHLRCKDAGSVLVLERNELASAASSRAAGLILQASTKATKTPLAKKTIDTIPILEDELDQSVGFHDVGCLRIAVSSERVAELEVIADDAATWGIPVEWLNQNEPQRRVPWLNTEVIQKSIFTPTDGYVDPYLLSMSYMEAAIRRGADVRPRTDVTDVMMDGERVMGVMTASGPIASGSVIDACGAWAALFSARVGFPLPMAPVRSHYWMSEPNLKYGAEHPMTILSDIGAYTRPEVGGLLVGVQETHSATFDARDLPDDPAAFSATRGEEHWDVLANAYDDLAKFFPDIEHARFSNYISGLSSYTPDGQIILGPVPGVSGFCVAAGDCGSGIALSAGMGDIVADLALGRDPFVDIAPFRADRFGAVDPFGQEFRDRCAVARASKTRTTA